MLFTFLLISTLSYGQSYEEKIAEKTCECISKDIETDHSDELLKKCIISSNIEVINNSPSKKENRQFTVEGIQRTFYNVSELVMEKCPAYSTKVTAPKNILRM